MFTKRATNIYELLESTLVTRVDAHLIEPIAQRIPRQAQQARGLALIAIGPAQSFANDLLLVLLKSHTLRQKVRDGRFGLRRLVELDIHRA